MIIPFSESRLGLLSSVPEFELVFFLMVFSDEYMVPLLYLTGPNELVFFATDSKLFSKFFYSMYNNFCQLI